MHHQICSHISNISRNCASNQLGFQNPSLATTECPEVAYKYYRMPEWGKPYWNAHIVIVEAMLSCIKWVLSENGAYPKSPNFMIKRFGSAVLGSFLKRFYGSTVPIVLLCAVRFGSKMWK